MRARIVAGNWKMNKNLTEAQQLTSEIQAMLLDEVRGKVEVILCPPYPYLLTVKHIVGENNTVSVGAQDCSEHGWGAYTGEVSAAMLPPMGVDYVIVGHSERRQYFGEDGALLRRKVDIALANGLTPIFCCGEPIEKRERGDHQDLVRKQIEESLFHLDNTGLRKIVIAYEPVWAIGTGKTATAAQAQEMHAVIRTHLAGHFAPALAAEVSILYGGSVKADNARELFDQPDVDGGLVGGASLKSREFVEIVKAAYSRA